MGNIIEIFINSDNLCYNKQMAKNMEKITVAINTQISPQLSNKLNDYVSSKVKWFTRVGQCVWVNQITKLLTKLLNYFLYL